MSEFSKPVIVGMNGVQILTASESSFAVKSNDSPVYTLAEGLAGFSDGAAEVTISLQTPIKTTGIEVDWAGLILDHVTIDMSYNLGGREYVVRGRVLDANMDSAVNQPNKAAMSFHGRVISRPPRT